MPAWAVGRRVAVWGGALLYQRRRSVGLPAVQFAVVGGDVGPLSRLGEVEALDVAIGARAVGLDPDVPDVVVGEQLLERPCVDVFPGVVGHHLLYGRAQPGVRRRSHRSGTRSSPQRARWCGSGRRRCGSGHRSRCGEQARRSAGLAGRGLHRPGPRCCGRASCARGHRGSGRTSSRRCAAALPAGRAGRG